jgi:hypothetical protein
MARSHGGGVGVIDRQVLFLEIMPSIAKVLDPGQRKEQRKRLSPKTSRQYGTG